jgi:hypothetical protein
MRHDNENGPRAVAAAEGLATGGKAPVTHPSLHARRTVAAALNVPRTTLDRALAGRSKRLAAAATQQTRYAMRRSFEEPTMWGEGSDN